MNNTIATIISFYIMAYLGYLNLRPYKRNKTVTQEMEEAHQAIYSEYEENLDREFEKTIQIEVQDEQ